jgi:hypothetical protein
VRRCDAILSTAIVFATIGGLGGAVLAGGALQMFVYAALGVWGGAIAGGLLGALRCIFSREPPNKLHPAGL